VKKTKHTVRLLRAAENDSKGIITYIGAENRIAAEMVATKVEKSLTRLSFYPYLGRIPKEEELRRLGYRFVVTEDYLIFYTVEDRTIFIHRMIHGAGDYFSFL
jgi:toxin ParE1/3/4